MSWDSKRIKADELDAHTQGGWHVYARILAADGTPSHYRVRRRPGDRQQAGDPEATSAAQELAEEADVDLYEVDGTGADGRILKADVEAAIDTNSTEATS